MGIGPDARVFSGLTRGRLWSVGPEGDGDGTGPLFGKYFGGLEDNVWPAPKS